MPVFLWAGPGSDSPRSDTWLPRCGVRRNQSPFAANAHSLYYHGGLLQRAFSSLSLWKEGTTLPPSFWGGGGALLAQLPHQRAKTRCSLSCCVVCPVTGQRHPGQGRGGAPDAQPGCPPGGEAGITAEHHRGLPARAPLQAAAAVACASGHGGELWHGGLHPGGAQGDRPAVLCSGSQAAPQQVSLACSSVALKAA